MIGDVQQRGETQRSACPNRGSLTEASGGILEREARSPTLKLDKNCPSRPIGTSRKRACALRVENLEVRSVPSGASPLGLSVFTSSLHLGPIAFVPAVSPPTDVSTPATVPSQSPPAPGLPIGTIASALTGAFTKPANSGLDAVTACSLPVVAASEVNSIFTGLTATVADVVAGLDSVVAGVVAGTTSGGRTSGSAAGGSAGPAGAGVTVGDSGLDVSLLGISLSLRSSSSPSDQGANSTTTSSSNASSPGPAAGLLNFSTNPPLVTCPKTTP